MQIQIQKPHWSSPTPNSESYNKGRGKQAWHHPRHAREKMYGAVVMSLVATTFCNDKKH